MGARIKKIKRGFLSELSVASLLFLSSAIGFSNN